MPLHQNQVLQDIGIDIVVKKRWVKEAVGLVWDEVRSINLAFEFHPIFRGYGKPITPDEEEEVQIISMLSVSCISFEKMIKCITILEQNGFTVNDIEHTDGESDYEIFFYKEKNPDDK